MTRIPIGAGRFAVAMSGGIDSTVAVALLLEQGHEVIGLTMHVAPLHGGHDEGMPQTCILSSAEEKAVKAAAALGIPHHVVDMTESFRRYVVRHFVEEYERGRTPNPCVLCNRFVKFGGLLEHALALGAETMATGHYARVLYDDSCGRWLLKRGTDRSKDQSYALYGLTQDQLARTIMPLGEMTKEQVRRLASGLALSAAEAPESQEICFVADRGYRAFLEEMYPDVVKPGSILDIEGREIGVHRGIAFYTVGQRRGLGIAAGEPLYVVGLDPARNAVIAGRDLDLYERGLMATDVNMVKSESLDKPFAATAKVRYNMRDEPATVSPAAEGRVSVIFDEPQRAITPGQAVVFYGGDDVIGGATIERTVDSS